jgi:hypothetical protein
MLNPALKTYARDNGGRVGILFLLFLLALFRFYSAGFGGFAIICAIPIIILVVIATFRQRMLTFWALIFVNYIIQWHSVSLPSGIPMSLYNEMLEIILIMLALLDFNRNRDGRLFNIMSLFLFIWCSYCTLEVLNDTCGLGIDVAGWYPAARMMAYQLAYAFVIFTLYINTPQKLLKYLYVWGALALFAVFWVWKQQTYGFTDAEARWLQTRGRTTHILYAGTLIRYFSIYSDAANYGIGIASTAVSFIIFGITSKLKKLRYIFLIIGLACAWGMFPSGTRTAIACFIAGLMAYIFLSKSLKIAIPFSILFGIFVFMLVFTKVGEGNQSIRRMRSAFNKNDASANARNLNQEAMKKYMKEAPWGIGMHIGFRNVPANNKYTYMAKVPPDSEYVFIWIHTGVIGITIFLICTAFMIGGAAWIILFRLRSSSLRGIGAGFCCGMIAMQLGGYANQVLMQFPNCLVFYGGLTLVYVLPHIEEEWMAYENRELEKQAEKKRLKLEKKKNSRIWR